MQRRETGETGERRRATQELRCTSVAYLRHLGGIHTLKKVVQILFQLRPPPVALLLLGLGEERGREAFH